jgi:adenylosuccinate synthase
VSLTVVVGAQYGSEGKGKVALHLAKTQNAVASVRVGGPNSGHTVVHGGRTHVFKQLPVASLLDGVVSILPPGCYIDVPTLLRELDHVGATPADVVIDPRAVIVTEEDRASERRSGLTERIGSTGSGTGAAVARRIRRDGTVVRAGDIQELAPYISDTLPLLHGYNNKGVIVIEGTQGYGLSLLHGLEGDFATSRDTTAAAFVAETGLSPRDVGDIALVVRAHPIRVAGNSGTLDGETSWRAIGENIGRDDLIEFTTVTQRIRRVGTFEPEIVQRAIYANNPTMVVLNHVDYVAPLDTEDGRVKAAAFLKAVSTSIDRQIDLVGIDAFTLLENHAVDGWLAECVR